MSDFERELEAELHRILDPMTAGSIPTRRAIESGGTMKKVLGGTGVAIGLKVLTGIVAAAAALTVAGAATEIATTGSLNPQDWGQQVSHQVQVCKDKLRASGTRGIGQCVSAFAKQHGKTVSESPKPTDNGKSNDNGNGNGNANGHGKNKGNANGHGKSSSSTEPTPTDNTEPTDPPGGHPPAGVTPKP